MIDQGVFYQVTSQNIADGKRLQWNTSYYSLLLYASLIALKAHITCALVLRCILPILSGAVVVAGFYFVSLGQHWQRQERTWRHKNIYHKAGVFWKSENEWAEYEEHEMKLGKWSSVLFLFYSAIGVGFLITFSILMNWI